MSLSLFIALFGLACGGGSGGGSGSDSGSVSLPTGSSSAGGCDWSGSYCYDFVGASWDAASAEAQCDSFSATAVSEGAPGATFESTGCAGGATAECTGFDGIPGDPDSDIIIYYYDDPPMAFAEDGCTAGGGTYTLY